MTEKIFARASEKPQLIPGENVWVNVDILMTHDVCGPGSIGIFKKEFGQDAKVFDCFRLAFFPLQVVLGFFFKKIGT
jgi:3-isopropylmalate/(R)-2-methylmalate dehydratase large subunit